MNSNVTKQTNLIPLTQWPEHHHWPSISGLRHLMFYRKTNGFDRAFIKVGKRVLIDEGTFFDIIHNQQEDRCGEHYAG